MRIVPSTICGERTVFLPTPAAMALPVRAANSAMQAITRAGEGRNERVLLVIGGSFRWVVDPMDQASDRSPAPDYGP